VELEIHGDDRRQPALDGLVAKDVCGIRPPVPDRAKSRSAARGMRQTSGKGRCSVLTRSLGSTGRIGGKKGVPVIQDSQGYRAERHDRRGYQ
jgi:hypothetical protein